jgi:hypothetical protein
MKLPPESDEQDPITFTQLSEVLERLMENFIFDLRELGQTQISACGPDWELTVKIEPKVGEQ